MPDWSQHVRPRLSGLRLSPTREAEIVEELSQHLEDRYRELIAGGMSPDEATQVALADFRDGNLLARYMAPLRQAHSPALITPGAPCGRLADVGAVGPALAVGQRQERRGQRHRRLVLRCQRPTHRILHR